MRLCPEAAQDPVGGTSWEFEFGLRELELGLGRHFSYLL